MVSSGSVTRHRLEFPICSSSQESVAAKMTSGFFPLKHMMYLFQTIIPTVSQHMSDMSVDKKLQPVERLLRHTSYIILSSAMFLEKCYTYEDETDHNEDKSVAGNKSTTARGIPFGIEGCIEAEKQIWT